MERNLQVINGRRCSRERNHHQTRARCVWGREAGVDKSRLARLVVAGEERERGREREEARERNKGGGTVVDVSHPLCIPRQLLLLPTSFRPLPPLPYRLAPAPAASLHPPPPAGRHRRYVPSRPSRYASACLLDVAPHSLTADSPPASARVLSSSWSFLVTEFRPPGRRCG